jgi:hypothetical protein
MFKKEVWVMVAIFLIPIILGIGIAIFYPWIKANS